MTWFENNLLIIVKEGIHYDYYMSGKVSLRFGSLGVAADVLAKEQVFRLNPDLAKCLCETSVATLALRVGSFSPSFATIFLRCFFFFSKASRGFEELSTV